MLVMFTSIAFLCLSLLGFIAPFFWFFDLFNHFRVQYLVGSIVGILIALTLRSKLPTLLFLSVGLINGFAIAPLYFPREKQPEFLTEISVLSYNIWRHNDDWTSVSALLKESDPDIAYFTEVHPDIRAAIGEIGPEYHIFDANADVLLVKRKTELRPKLVETEKVIGGVIVTFLVKDVEITLMGIHPAAPLSKTAARVRDQSFAALTSFLNDREGLAIVVGDFNATPWSHSFRALEKETGLVNSQKGFGVQPSWPSYPGSYFNWLLRVPIDHCLHSPSIYTINREVSHFCRSNHNPIFLRLGVKPPS